MQRFKPRGNSLTPPKRVSFRGLPTVEKGSWHALKRAFLFLERTNP